MPTEDTTTAIADGVAIATGEAVVWFDGSRLGLLIVLLFVCAAVIACIWRARSGRPVRIRRIAALEAVDEAVGRAT